MEKPATDRRIVNAQWYGPFFSVRLPKERLSGIYMIYVGNYPLYISASVQIAIALSKHMLFLQNTIVPVDLLGRDIIHYARIYSQQRLNLKVAQLYDENNRLIPVAENIGFYREVVAAFAYTHRLPCNPYGRLHFPYYSTYVFNKGKYYPLKERFLAKYSADDENADGEGPVLTPLVMQPDKEKKSEKDQQVGISVKMPKDMMVTVSGASRHSENYFEAEEICRPETKAKEDKYLDFDVVESNLGTDFLAMIQNDVQQKARPVEAASEPEEMPHPAESAWNRANSPEKTSELAFTRRSSGWQMGEEDEAEPVAAKPRPAESAWKIFSPPVKSSDAVPRSSSGWQMGEEDEAEPVAAKPRPAESAWKIPSPPAKSSDAMSRSSSGWQMGNDEDDYDDDKAESGDVVEPVQAVEKCAAANIQKPEMPADEGKGFAELVKDSFRNIAETDNDEASSQKARWSSQWQIGVGLKEGHPSIFNGLSAIKPQNGLSAGQESERNEMDAEQKGESEEKPEYPTEEPETRPKKKRMSWFL